MRAAVRCEKVAQQNTQADATKVDPVDGDVTVSSGREMEACGDGDTHEKGHGAATAAAGDGEAWFR